MPRKGAPKGHPKWGGRQKGTRNKTWLDPNYWMGLYYETIESSDPEKKIQNIQWALTMMFSKMQTLPGTPADSVANATATFDELKKLEESKPVPVSV